MTVTEGDTSAPASPTTARPSGDAPDGTVETGRDDQPGRRRKKRINWPLLFGAGILLSLILAAVLAPLLAAHSPNTQNLLQRLQPPSSDHLLGTDSLGRDQFSRLLYGGRSSLLAGALAVGIGALVGIPLGVLAGYRAGWTDTVIGRVVDVMMSVPALIFALTVIAALGTGLTNAMIAVGIIMIPVFARLARGATKDVIGRGFFDAAKANGCSSIMIIRRHVLHHIASPLIAQVCIMMGVAIAAEASLSFVGLGTRPPAASWGSMLQSAFADIDQASFLVYAPGVAITLSVLAWALLGDGVRRALHGGTTNVADSARGGYL